MVTKKDIRDICEKEGKKIGNQAYEIIERKIRLDIKKMIKDASINADFGGRKVLKAEDFE